MLRKDCCSGTSEGGVAKLVRNDMYCTELRTFDSDWQGNEKVIGIKVKGINIINIYNKPSDTLSNSLLKLILSLDNVVICGDLNAHHPTWGSAVANSSGKNLNPFLENVDYVLLNLSVPTHFITSDRAVWSLIDLTIVSSQIAHNCTTNITHDFLGSDHSIILTYFDIPTKLHLPKWNFGRADWTAFSNKCLHQITNTLVSKNIDKFSEQVTESLLGVATATIPQSKTGGKKNFAPWWNKQCAVAGRNKKHAFNRMKRTRLPSDIIIFKRLRAKSRKVILLAKQASWQHFCNSINNNTKLAIVWKALKKFCGCNYSFHMPALKNNGNTAKTEHEKANMLAEQFRSVSATSNYSSKFYLTGLILTELCNNNSNIIELLIVVKTTN